MRLLNGTLRPARVIEVLDNACVKVEAPGMFSSEDQDLLPPVMPFFGNHSNTWSEPEIGDEVWLLSMSDNPLDLHWFRKDENTTENEEILDADGSTNVEILCNRPSGMGYASIYFTDGSGWMIKNDDSIVNIRPNGSIVLNTGIPYRCVDICDSSISLGTEGGSAHPACYGDAVQTVLEYIQTALDTIKQAADCNMYTKPIGLALNTLPTIIAEKIPEIISPNVTLD